jgi:hypothetical protein
LGPDDLPTWPEELREDVEERVAIMVLDGNVPEQEAWPLAAGTTAQARGYAMAGAAGEA